MSHVSAPGDAPRNRFDPEAVALIAASLAGYDHAADEEERTATIAVSYGDPHDRAADHERDDETAEAFEAAPREAAAVPGPRPGHEPSDQDWEPLVQRLLPVIRNLQQRRSDLRNELEQQRRRRRRAHTRWVNQARGLRDYLRHLMSQSDTFADQYGDETPDSMNLAAAGSDAAALERAMVQARDSLNRRLRYLRTARRVAYRTPDAPQAAPDLVAAVRASLAAAHRDWNLRPDPDDPARFTFDLPAPAIHTELTTDGDRRIVERRLDPPVPLTPLRLRCLVFNNGVVGMQAVPLDPRRAINWIPSQRNALFLHPHTHPSSGELCCGDLRAITTHSLRRGDLAGLCRVTADALAIYNPASRHTALERCANPVCWVCRQPDESVAGCLRCRRVHCWHCAGTCRQDAPSEVLRALQDWYNTPPGDTVFRLVDHLTHEELTVGPTDHRE